MGKKDDKVQYQLKVPKGTKDWDGRDMAIREKIFGAISDVFKRHGAVTIDTPVFELKEILAGKYGEDSKLIYDLADQGGEICSLRYDLTVPFARWLAMTGTTNIKRYHIAKVYRRDQPAMTKGRMREFYQCDFDIAGVYDPLMPDAEIIRIATEVFEALGWRGNYIIKINHRKVLDGIFQVCGVPDEKIRSISSSVDKLDKSPWEEVRREMTEEKGLDSAIADKIGTYVVQKGRLDLLEKLQADEALSANASAKQGLADMATLFKYLQSFQVLDKVSFDMSLARGLDYYTGVIYEVVTEGSAPAAPAVKPAVPTSTAATSEAQQLQTEAKSASKKKQKKGGAGAGGEEDDDRSSDPTIGVGSIAGGGRYDGLVSMFSGKKEQIPCVGISFGVERIFSIIKSRLAQPQPSTATPDNSPFSQAHTLRATETEAWVMALGTPLLAERMQICTLLWQAGIKAEFSYKEKAKLPQQFKAADTAGVPFGVILGEAEWARGEVKVKELGLPDGHPEKDGVPVQMAELVGVLAAKIAAWRTGAGRLNAGAAPAGGTAAVTQGVQDLNVGEGQ